jgi:hypothetical protein
MQLVSHPGDDHSDVAASLRKGLDEALTLKDDGSAASMLNTWRDIPLPRGWVFGEPN